MKQTNKGNHQETPTGTSTAPADDENNNQSNTYSSLSPKKEMERPSSKKKKSAPSDCRNESFEEYLRTRPEIRVDVIEQVTHLVVVG